MAGTQGTIDSEWSVVTDESLAWTMVDSSSRRSTSKTLRGADEGLSSLSLESFSDFSSLSSIRTREDIVSWNEANDVEEENSWTDMALDEKWARRQKRQGKGSLRSSLVKRNTESWCRQPDGYVESVRPLNKDGTSPKTAVDDVIGLDMSKVYRPDDTLGRSQRWQILPELMEELEKEGMATQVPTLPHPRYFDRRGRYAPPPMASTTYEVKAHGFHRYSVSSRSRPQQASNSQGAAVYTQRRGRWTVLYELRCEPPPELEEGNKSQFQTLRGNLRATPGTPVLDGSARHAFVPGVRRQCANGYGGICSWRRAVVRDRVDLVFGRPVLVSYAAVAGRIHATWLERIKLAKLDDYGPGRKKGQKPRSDGGVQTTATIPVAMPGTEAYCDRVEISARLVANPRVWISLGIFDGNRDCHSEKTIYLGRCDAATKDGAIPCVALRFRAVSWHNEPFFRVGAYGTEHPSPKLDGNKNQRTRCMAMSPTTDGPSEDTVLYTLHRLVGSCPDDTETRERDTIQRRYAKKEGPSYREYSCFGSGQSNRAKKRVAFRTEIREAEKYRDSEDIYYQCFGVSSHLQACGGHAIRLKSFTEYLARHRYYQNHPGPR